MWSTNGSIRPWRFSGEAQNLGDACCQARPILLFLFQLPAPGRGQRIDPRTALTLGDGPLRIEPPLLLHTMERGVQRALLDTQQIVRHGLNMLSDSIAVRRPARKSLKD